MVSNLSLRNGFFLKLLERLALRRRPQDGAARYGEMGEDAALFFLIRNDYTVVARRWMYPGHRGELDLVAWDRDTLCIVEVKTRGARGMVPAEFAVDEDKQRMLRKTAARYVGTLPRKLDRSRLRVRFDVVSVYLAGQQPEMELFRNAFGAHSVQ